MRFGKQEKSFRKKGRNKNHHLLAFNFRIRKPFVNMMLFAILALYLVSTLLYHLIDIAKMFNFDKLDNPIIYLSAKVRANIDCRDSSLEMHDESCYSKWINQLQ